MLNYPSDIDELHTVMVHSPGDEIAKVVTLAPADHAALPADYMGAASRTEYAHFIQLLKRQDVNIIEFVEALDEALQTCAERGILADWLSTSFGPSVADWVDVDNLTAKDLVGASDRVFYNLDSTTRRLSPIFPPQKWLFFCRDFAAATPRGLIICNFANQERQSEPAIARLVFENAVQFKSVPIAFDAMRAGVYMQGGDLIVLDRDTVLLGINNLTEKRAARALAQALDMRVVAVNLPPALSVSRNPYARFTNANLLFLHLDSVFTLVDRDKFLVVPYWFEDDEGTELLTNILLGLMPQGELQQRVIAQLASVGSIALYHPRTGKREECRLKLVPFLKGEGYTPIYVGGAKDRKNPYKYLVERVLPELRFQAPNTVALSPGEVIAYEGNQPYTLGTLHDHGIHTHTFESHELVRWNGGPHCMTMPLERRR